MNAAPTPSEPIRATAAPGPGDRLADALARAARLHPDHGVIYLDRAGRERGQAYPELLDQAARILTGLRGRGLRPGDPLIFQLEHAPDFIPVFWACALGGFLPAPVSIAPTYEQPHGILDKLANTWTLLDQPPVVAGAALAERLRAWARRDGRADFRVITVEELRPHAPARAWAEPAAEDPALLLLTSGSTGRPKAVVQTSRNLLAWAAGAAAACGFHADDVSLNWMPLDHVGGLVMFHLRDLVLGCRQIHAPTDAVLPEPLVWLDWIERHRATITWAPNFAYGLICDRAAEIAARRWDLASMRFILNGGEAIVGQTARRFLELLEPHGLPASAMRPAWGMSETCSGVTYSRRFSRSATRDADPLVDVGEPIGGIELRIVDAADTPVAAGRTGRLQVRGISVTPGYYRNPEANRQAFTTDGWFITGDLGRIQDGQLAITGREKDVIIINGVNFYSHEIEATVEALPGVDVSFTAACAVRQPAEDTDRLAVFFCPTPAGRTRLPELCAEIRATLAARAGVTADFLLPVERADIPKTVIGKIQRSQLRESFAQGRFAVRSAPDASRPADAAPSGLFAQVWAEAPLPDARPLPPASQVLLFADPELGPLLGAGLRANGHTCTVVEPGAAFGPGGPAEFFLNPEDPDDYRRLFDALPDRGRTLTHVVHAWAYPATPPPQRGEEIEERQALGSLSLLRLLRAWAAEGEPVATVRLLVVTSGVQAHPRTASLDWSKAPLLGVARTIPHECAWLQTVHLDLEGQDAPADAADARAELAARSIGEAAVRRRTRYEPQLEPVPAAIAPPPPLAPPAGITVLTGGLGGIGQRLAHRLAAESRKVVILGRRPDGAAVRRILDGWTNDGIEVQYECGDVTDPAFVRSVLARAVARWHEPVRTLIHLAGEYHEAPLVEETDRGFLAALRPKLLGAWALDQAAREHPGCRFIGFSSLLGYFGALGTGAYAAANAGLDAFAQQADATGPSRCTLLWSLWLDTGMGRRGRSDILGSRGFLSLAPDQALDALDAAVATGRPALWIGLDPRHPGGPARLGVAAVAAGAGSAVFEPPETDLERKLAALWADILGVPRIGRRDNFFSLGGRSLLGARLFARIKRELGVDLPLATLYIHPTLAALAAQLTQPAGPAPRRALPLQSNGGDPAIFCIPGGGSDASVFQDLAHELGPERPCYGLQAPGLDAVAQSGPIPSVEEVAGDFIGIMQGIQPHGPYHVAGHCFGSLLAWEVARQLAARDEAVGVLALLDPTVSNVFSDDILGWDRLVFHGRKFLRLSLRDQGRYLRERVRNFRRTVVVRQRIAQSFDQARAMHQRYRLEPYSGAVVIVLAEESFRRLRPERDPRRYYERLAQGGTQYLSAGGDHDAMLHRPHVAAWSRRLREHLRVADGGAVANDILVR